MEKRKTVSAEVRKNIQEVNKTREIEEIKKRSATKYVFKRMVEGKGQQYQKTK